MIDTGCALESLAMRSSEAATGTRTTTQACSISTTTGLTTTTTTSASADPTLQRLDAGHAATEGSILVESIPQVTAKARRQLNQTSAKPKTAAAPTGAVVECGQISAMNSKALILATPSLELLAKRLEKGIYRFDIDGLHKKCCRCHDFWPADSEFFHSNINETDGLVGYCKACYLDRRYPNGRSMKNLEVIHE